MSKGMWRRRTIFPLSWSLVAALACGAPPVAKAPHVAPASASAEPPPAPTPAPVAVPEPAPKPEPRESAGFSEALAALRPPEAQATLQALTAAPADPKAYADAALAYASSVPAMTLLWGLSYQAMGGGSSDAAIASALSHLLTERITATPDPQTKEVRFNLRLAPGQMPIREEVDGSVHAPLAHAFEGLFGPTVTSFRPPWTVLQFYDAMSIWTGLVATHGTPLDEQVELDGWLVTTAKAGHLEAFCFQLVGPAFPAELKAYKAANRSELKAYQSYLEASPLTPKHAAMPDDMVRLK